MTTIRSPAVILMGVSDGVVTGSFVVFGMFLLGSLVFGRAFCGWVCPAGANGEAVGRLRDRRITRRWVSRIKYALWVPWLGLIAGLAVRAGGMTRVEFTYQTWHGVSVGSWNAPVVFAIVLAVIVGLAAFVGRKGVLPLDLLDGSVYDPRPSDGRSAAAARTSSRRTVGEVRLLWPMHAWLPHRPERFKR